MSGRFRWLAVLGLVATGVALPAQPATAQSLAVHGVAAYSGQALLGSVYGAGIAVGVPLRGDQASLNLGVTRLAGSTHRIGPPCGGFIVPGICPDEPLRDDARVTHFSVGLGLRIWHRAPFTLSFVSGLRVARVAATTYGLASGVTISADKTLWGAETGFEAALRPWRQRPLAIRFGVGGMGLVPLHRDDAVDAYLPFDEPTSLASVWLGVVWHGVPR